MNDLPTSPDLLMQFLYRAPIGLVQTAFDGKIEMLNPMSAQLLMPLSRDGMLDNLFTVLDVVAPELRALAAEDRGLSGLICEDVRISLAPVDIDNPAPKVLSVSLMRLDECRLMAVLSDVTLQVRREQQGLARRLSDAARIDVLTQMPNRVAILERIQQAMANIAGTVDREIAVLFISCDRFRQINDTLGHKIGDQMLSLMASRLQSGIRPQDVVSRATSVESKVARIGGDEFVILLDELSHAEDSYKIAQRLIETLNRPYGIGTHQVHCAVSIGIALGAQACGDADALLQNGSIAMREAKRAGGARFVVFESSMQERAARRGGIESDLRRALGADELFVMYQPVVWMQSRHGQTGRAAGVEALVRWRHPDRGLIPPSEFIGIAEECGLISAVGDFVLASACRDFMVWQRRFGSLAPGSIAVNLSRAQLYQPDLVAKVTATLRSTGMRANQLQFEVTESLAAQDATVQARLRELKALQLTLALDDFGTGYSSLSSLHLPPVDTVKIDRSFVCQADTSPHHRVLIEATVRVASSLGMSIVAEGIETRAQASVVRTLGCDKGQGYYWSKPLSAPDLEVWLEAAPSPRYELLESKVS
jgi:diguanylate cyclase (GGDEF)-like protein